MPLGERGGSVMRKIGICAAVLALVNILCCCSGAKDILLKTASYSGRAHIQYGDSEYTADVAVGEAGAFTFTVTEPADLAGLTVTMDGTGLELTFAGMSWRGGSSDFPQTAAATAVKNSFAAASVASENLRETSEGTFVLEGSSGSGDYRFTFDAAGTPKALTIPALDLDVAFEEIEG